MFQPRTPLERLSERLTQWIGSTSSIVLHTVLFIGIFALKYAGVSTDEILLILTTAVSLEAIYLAIFIQMTVNRHSQSLADVEENIEDLGEEVEDLGEDIGELAEDVDELSEDVEEISEDIEEIQDEDETDARHDVATRSAIDSIEGNLRKLVEEVEALKQAMRK
jgi:uncharacterized membrane protein